MPMIAAKSHRTVLGKEQSELFNTEGMGSEKCYQEALAGRRRIISLVSVKPSLW